MVTSMNDELVQQSTCYNMIKEFIIPYGCEKK